MFNKGMILSLIAGLALLASAAYYQDSLATVSPVSATAEAAEISETAATSDAASAADAPAENSEAQAAPGVVRQESAPVSISASIVLDGESIVVDGEGVTVEDSVATITEAGAYSISGALADGQIVVAAADDAAVTLVLNGVDLRSSTSAPIYLAGAGEVVIVLAEGSENFVSDAATYVYEDPTVDEPNAAIFSDVDLTIEGGGALAVEGNFNDGIGSKDDLTIDGGSITVDAADDGIRGKDSLVINDGVITVAAQGDGLKSDNEEDADRGYISIEGGVFAITAGDDAVQAQTGLSIAGGEFSIDAAGDGLNAIGDITIGGGAMTLAVGDDGIHSEANLTIRDGDIRITQSVEGLEAMVITLDGGNVHVASSDDGVNISGDVQEGRGMGRPGQRVSEYTGVYWLYINGGYLAVNASGDGIDANGAIEMTGGTVVVHGPTQSMNGALDYDGTFNISGGLLAAAGSAGMATTAGETSGQNALLINFTSWQEAGTLVHIQDSKGNTLLTFAPEKEVQSLAFSSPDLVQGETYEVYLGGSATGAASDGLYQDGAYTPGELYTSFTVEGAVTTIGNAGRGMRSMRP